MGKIYLDNSATTKPLPTIPKKIIPYINDYWHNPSSIYNDGVKVRRDIENVRCKIAKRINAEPDEIFFTSGAAEANAWAIRGWWDHQSLNESNNEKNSAYGIITSTVEHSSIHRLKQTNIPVYQVMSCDDGRIIVEDLEYTICNFPDLIGKKNKSLNNFNRKIKHLASIIFANNEIGTINDVSGLAKISHSYGGVFHTDATQAFGHIPIDVKTMGIDMMSASSQKIGGLKGTGFLYVRKDIRIEPLIYGTQENHLRGGTENVIGIIAMGEAVENIDLDIQEEIAEWRDDIIDKLLNEGCFLNGSKDARLPNNINIILPYGISAEAFVYIFDLAGIQISRGSACESGNSESSHVLKSIGLSAKQAASSIRISLPDIRGLPYSKEEITNKLMSEFRKAVKIFKSNI